MQALKPGMMLAGRYRLVEPLGSGGMSQVWRARDDVLGRLVAVKVLSAELGREESTRDLLRREARAMAMVSDPHVANVHDYGEYDADGVVLPFVVMELVHGRTLAQALRQGPLPWPEAVRVAAQVASGLAAAHEHGVVHCDVTPANVVLTRAGVKVVDFGIATVLGASRTEARFGTAGYAAPECYDPQAPITPAVDAYSLGIVLCEAMTGQFFDDPQRLGELLPDLPADVIDLCRRCLAESPASRPSAAEIATTLAALIIVHNGLPSETPAAAPIVTPPTEAMSTAILTGGGKRRLVTAAAIGLVIAAVAALALTFGHNIQVATAPELTSAPTTAGPAPSAAAPRPVTSPTGRGNSATANLRQLVLAGQAAGEIRPHCAESLLSRIADLQRRIDRGDTDNARQRIEQIGEEIDDRVSDGEVTRTRAVDLRQALAAVVI